MKLIRAQQLDNGGMMRPPQGLKKKFEHASEKEMFDYLCYCWELGIPIMQDRFGHKLVHCMEYYGIDNKFAKVFPGNELIILC